MHWVYSTVRVGTVSQCTRCSGSTSNYCRWTRSAIKPSTATSITGRNVRQAPTETAVAMTTVGWIVFGKLWFDKNLSPDPHESLSMARLWLVLLPSPGAPRGRSLWVSRIKLAFLPQLNAGARRDGEADDKFAWMRDANSACSSSVAP
jgi:hypothetical protein